MDSISGLDIGRRIKQRRQDQGITQEQLALRAKVNRSWLAALETGHIKNPRADALTRVAKALGMDIDYLTHGSTQEGVVVKVSPEKAGFLERWKHLPVEAMRDLDQFISRFLAHDLTVGYGPNTEIAEHREGHKTGGSGEDDQ